MVVRPMSAPLVTDPLLAPALPGLGPDAPVPGALQFLAFLSEFGGGIALLLGLLTPVAALGVLSTMARMSADI